MRARASGRRGAGAARSRVPQRPGRAASSGRAGRGCEVPLKGRTEGCGRRARSFTSARARSARNCRHRAGLARLKWQAARGGALLVCWMAFPCGRSGRPRQGASLPPALHNAAARGQSCAATDSEGTSSARGLGGKRETELVLFPWERMLLSQD